MSETDKQTPRIIMDTAAQAIYDLDPDEVADTLRQAGVQEVASHTIDVSSERRFNGGATAPKWLDRLVNGPSEANAGPGSVIRIHTSTKMRPNPRTSEQLDELLAHEAQHVAQIERHDKRLAVGFITMGTLALLGGYAGNRLTVNKHKPIRALGVTVGALIGYKIGYQLAAHETQARAHATNHTSHAFREK